MVGIMKQRTIKKAFEFSGVGLHTGRDVDVYVRPAKAGRGIRFIRVDLPGKPIIKANTKKVVSTSYATTIGKKGATVSTIEHLMAAFYGMGIDNAIVEINGPEVPVMDGSSRSFVSMISSAGEKLLAEPRKYIVIKKAVRVEIKDRFAEFVPSDGEPSSNALKTLTIDYTMDFDHSILSKQSISLTITPENFSRELSSARTYGFLRDVDMLRAAGLAKGGNLSNAVVIGEDKILNPEGLRFEDEFVRHKTLDLIGDIALGGMRIIGKIRANRAGHDLNHKLIVALLEDPSSWELVEATWEEADERIPVFTEELATA